MEHIIKTIEFFLNTVEQLSKRNTTGKKLYALTNEYRYINFRANDFKKKLTELCDGQNIEIYLTRFRLWGFIICEKERFTRPQKINGKIVRVIVVNKQIYDSMIKLREEMGGDLMPGTSKGDII